MNQKVKEALAVILFCIITLWALWVAFDILITVLLNRMFP